mgnify:CR=1 FL=1
MTTYQEFPIPNEKVGAYNLIGYNPEVYQDIRTQLQGLPARYRQDAESPGTIPIQKDRFGRLEALANGLYKKLKQTKKGAVTFNLKEVLSYVSKEYSKISGKKKKSKEKGKSKDTLTVNIQNVINMITIVDETQRIGLNHHQFQVFYRTEGKSEYGYLIPKTF